MSANNLAEKAVPFLDYLEAWENSLPGMPIQKAVADPARTAILSVDVINGFCYEGPLASPRVAGIVKPIRALFQAAWERGLRQIVLVQDAHEQEAVEFGQWPSHCVRGTSEAQTVTEIRSLSFFDQMVVLEKNSIHAGHNTDLDSWLSDHPQVDTFITVGDCTDLCTYQLAMHVRLRANATQRAHRVIVPANCVDTYDLPVDAAKEIGAIPHPADLLHAVFLYHMALNGVEVVSEIAG